MKQLFVGFFLVLGLSTGFASQSLAVNEKSRPSTQGQSLFVDNGIMGQQGIELFRFIGEKSGLYAFLLALDNGVPAVSRQLEYVALFNEVHSANHNLSQILLALQKNNQLLECQIQKGGAAMDG